MTDPALTSFCIHHSAFIIPSLNSTFFILHSAYHSCFRVYGFPDGYLQAGTILKRRCIIKSSAIRVFSFLIHIPGLASQAPGPKTGRTESHQVINRRYAKNVSRHKGQVLQLALSYATICESAYLYLR